MEDKAAGRAPAGVSPREAKAALLAVSDVTASAGWEPRRWAAVVAGMAFAPVITAAVWERFWWFYAGLALWGIVLVVLRRQLFNPHVRVRPWQHLDKQQGEGDTWGLVFWPLWIPVTMLVSGLPLWIGPIVGVLAGSYTYWAMRQLGERR